VIETISWSIGLASLAAVFGAMVFFPAVVAPTVFRVLEPAPAGKFLRALFPGYYLFLIITSGIAAVGLYAQLIVSLGMVFVCVSTLAVRQHLVPRINAWRDAELAGDEAAGKKFALGHRVSVLINLVQLVIVIAALAVSLLAVI
jgi:hypothetical protein